MISFWLFLKSIKNQTRKITNLVIQNHVNVQNLNDAISTTQSFVIFDGSCGFCNYSAMFIAKRDVSDRFTLVSNSSDFGKRLLTQHNLERVSPHSIILIEGEKVSTKSKAIRTILQEIPGYRFPKFLLRVVPVFIQNLFYDGIARNPKIPPSKIQLYCSRT